MVIRQRLERPLRPAIVGAVCVTFAAATGCTDSGPLDVEAQRALPGALYYLVGGVEHDEASVVRRLSFNSSADTQVTDGSAPAFVYGVDPAGKTLALTIADDLYLADTSGADKRKVASSPEIDWYPRFSPDGRYVAFESARASFRDLYRLEVATGTVVRLTDHPAGNFDVAWSPDGSKLAFASSRAGQLDLWMMNADGTGKRRLTRHAGDSVKPQWSPSGRYIAFISARDGRDDLYVITPSNDEITKLSTSDDHIKRGWDAPHVKRFTWHPTEDRLAYAAQPPRGHSQIHVVEAATGNSRRLSKAEHDDREPSWSPDGAHIAFASERDGGSQIFIMSAEGDRRTRLTHHEHRAWLPRWVRGTSRSNP